MNTETAEQGFMIPKMVSTKEVSTYGQFKKSKRRENV